MTAGNNRSHRLIITSDEPEFDQDTISLWIEEGFMVTYLPRLSDSSKYASSLQSIAESLDTEEGFVLIAYGAAADQVLEIIRHPLHNLSGVVGYYPEDSPKEGSLPSVKVLLHMTSNNGPVSAPYKAFRYPDTTQGFTTPGSPAFDLVATRLAWSRTLGFVKKIFDIENDLEAIWEEHLAWLVEFVEKAADATMETMVAEPYVNHIPTMTGGIGAKDLYRFYKDYFIPMNPPSMTMKLISRTVGVDRVVDELYFKFCHTNEIPWLLPGVAPTNREVEVVIVSIVCIRGTKLYHEHIYWDQASVLAQIGLIDSTILPVVGAEGARKVLDEKSQASNRLIKDW